MYIHRVASYISIGTVDALYSLRTESKPVMHRVWSIASSLYRLARAAAEIKHLLPSHVLAQRESRASMLEHKH